MIKKILITFLLVTIFSHSLTHVLAYENQESTTSSIPIQLPYEKINPKDGFKFSFKRLQEKIIFAFFTFSAQSKYMYQRDLLSKRLAELKYVVDNKDISNIQTTSQRYYTTAGDLTQFTIKNNQDKNAFKEQLSSHLLILENLKKEFNDTTAEWRFIEHDIDYIKTYISQLN